ncbi:Glyoxalase/Bleomycin resistance protein/Dihydroxybiphenyl dioxygenase [Thermoascus aurantiacus ATCC 26904]
MSMSTDSKSPHLPPLSHILETCLYVRDLKASVKFYRDNFLMEPFLESPRVAAFSLGLTTLLLFQLGQTAADIRTPAGLIPGHGPSAPVTAALLDIFTPGSSDVGLRQHFCLAVRDPADVDRWEEHLRSRGVKVRGRMEWERGGRSVYFEDLDGHVGEIGSRGIWAHY